MGEKTGNPRGRPKGVKNKERVVERVPAARFAELMDGSSPRTAGERLWKRRFERMPPQEQVRRRLDLEPKARLPDESGGGVNFVISGAWPGACPHCGGKIDPVSILEPYKNPPAVGAFPGASAPFFPAPSPTDSRAIRPTPSRRMVLPEPSDHPAPVELSYEQKFRAEEAIRNQRLDKELIALNQMRALEGLPQLGTMPAGYTGGSIFNPVKGF